MTHFQQELESWGITISNSQEYYYVTHEHSEIHVKSPLEQRG